MRMPVHKGVRMRPMYITIPSLQKRPKLPPPSDVGGFLGSIYLLASRTPVSSKYIGQGRDSKQLESGFKPRGTKSWGGPSVFPRAGTTEIPGWNDRDLEVSIDSQPVSTISTRLLTAASRVARKDRCTTLQTHCIVKRTPGN